MRIESGIFEGGSAKSSSLERYCIKTDTFEVIRIKATCLEFRRIKTNSSENLYIVFPGTIVFERFLLFSNFYTEIQ
jgi:hypothetical protein